MKTQVQRVYNPYDCQRNSASSTSVMYKEIKAFSFSFTAPPPPSGPGPGPRPSSRSFSPSVSLFPNDPNSNEEKLVGVR